VSVGTSCGNPALAGRKAALEARAAIIASLRAFFRREGYLEVETPHRIPAPAPEPHIDAPGADGWYLHTSPELCMKRLLAAGYPRLFQVCRCFRQGERGRRHLPEFTLLEWYCAGMGYRELMGFCERLVRHAAAAAGKPEHLVYGQRQIALGTPWPRLTLADAFRRYAGSGVEQALAEDRFDERLALEVEPALAQWDQPVFLVDYPVACAALARRQPAAPHLAERFELYIAGLELCNSFGELTDPDEQRRRFERDRAVRRRGGKQDYPLPEPFLRELASMPAAAGSALGLDRLVMLLLDAASIDEVVAFTPEEL
jgi:lysyl-tRNA synthetase class 2